MRYKDYMYKEIVKIVWYKVNFILGMYWTFGCQKWAENDIFVLWLKILEGKKAMLHHTAQQSSMYFYLSQFSCSHSRGKRLSYHM